MRRMPLRPPACSVVVGSVGHTTRPSLLPQAGERAIRLEARRGLQSTCRGAMAPVVVLQSLSFDAPKYALDSTRKSAGARAATVAAAFRILERSHKRKAARQKNGPLSN